MVALVVMANVLLYMTVVDMRTINYYDLSVGINRVVLAHRIAMVRFRASSDVLMMNRLS